MKVNISMSDFDVNTLHVLSLAHSIGTLLVRDTFSSVTWGGGDIEIMENLARKCSKHFKQNNYVQQKHMYSI